MGWVRMRAGFMSAARRTQGRLRAFCRPWRRVGLRLAVKHAVGAISPAPRGDGAGVAAPALVPHARPQGRPALAPRRPASCARCRGTSAGAPRGRSTHRPRGHFSIRSPPQRLRPGCSAAGAGEIDALGLQTPVSCEFGLVHAGRSKAWKDQPAMELGHRDDFADGHGFSFWPPARRSF